MKLISILTYVFITLAISINTLGAKAMSKVKSDEQNESYEAIKIKDFLEDGSVLLRNGEYLKLAGINTNTISVENREKIKKSLVGKHIVFIKDNYGEHNEGYLYLLDKDDGFFPKNMLASEPDGRGFLNVKKGLSNVKGFAYNINVALIKLGYAKVDHSREFEYNKEFREYENHASQ